MAFIFHWWAICVKITFTQSTNRVPCDLKIKAKFR